MREPRTLPARSSPGVWKMRTASAGNLRPRPGEATRGLGSPCPARAVASRNPAGFPSSPGSVAPRSGLETSDSSSPQRCKVSSGLGSPGAPSLQILAIPPHLGCPTAGALAAAMLGTPAPPSSGQTAGTQPAGRPAAPRLLGRAPTSCRALAWFGLPAGPRDGNRHGAAAPPRRGPCPLSQAPGTRAFERQGHWNTSAQFFLKEKKVFFPSLVLGNT